MFFSSKRYGHWGNNVLPFMYIAINSSQKLLSCINESMTGQKSCANLKMTSCFWERKLWPEKVMVKIVSRAFEPIFGQIYIVCAKAYRPGKYIEDVIVQVDIIVQARFCNFQAISRSV